MTKGRYLGYLGNEKCDFISIGEWFYKDMRQKMHPRLKAMIYTMQYTVL